MVAAIRFSGRRSMLPADAVQRTPPPPPAPLQHDHDAAVQAPALHGGRSDVPPPTHYAEHTVQSGETLSEISKRYQAPVPLLQAANPDIADPDRIHVGQKVAVPIGPGYGSEPTEVQVKPGQTLSQLAAQYKQPLGDIVNANRHGIADPDRIRVGQQIWIPGVIAPLPTANVNPTPAPAPTPIDAASKATDAALQRVVSAQKTYDDVAASTQGSGAALPYLAQNLADAKGQLSSAVGNELTLRTQTALPPGHGATEADYAKAGAAIAQRQQGHPAEAKLVGDTLKALATQRQVDAIVAPAKAETDPLKAVQVLNQGFAKAPPEVRDAVLASPDVQALITKAADWADQPLVAKPDNAAGPQAPALQTMQRLDQLTQGLDRDLAARVVGQALPGFEKYAKNYEQNYGSQPVGPTGVATMMKVLDRVAGTPAGDADIDRFAALGIWNEDSVRNAIAEGATPAYAIALAKQPGVDSPRVLQAALDGVATFRQKISDDAGAYGKQMAELGWLVQNHGGVMTPDQLDKAIADYAKDKGPDWQKKTEQLKNTLADDGAKLMAQLQALQHLPPELGALQGQANQTVQDALNDPKAHLAISTALQQRPALSTGAEGNKLLSFFSDAQFVSTSKLTDQARKLASEFATAHVKSTVLAKIGDFDPADPASVARAKDALEELRSSRFASVLGVSDSNLNKAIDALEATIPQAGESAADTAKRVAKLNDTLDGFKGFDKATFAGQMLRGLGIALAGVGFLASASKAQADPSLKNDLKVIVDAAGLGQKGTELLIGLGKVDADSTLGKLGGSAAAKFLGVLSAGFDVWNSAEAFSKGDIPAGVLYGVGAGGGLLAAFGAGSLAGPIGIGLVVVSVVGLGIWNHVKDANQHEPDSDGGVSMRFLQHAGFSEQAARALVDQSGDGRSPVPLLQRYAELKGLHMDNAADRQKLVDWVNAMPSDKLAALRDDMHHELDHIDGDVSRFNASADDDGMVVPDIANRPWFARFGDAEPHSAAQLDAMLKVLQLPAL
jgi:LysM repeat protein